MSGERLDAEWSDRGGSMPMRHYEADAVVPHDAWFPARPKRRDARNGRQPPGDRRTRGPDPDTLRSDHALLGDQRRPPCPMSTTGTSSTPPRPSQGTSASTALLRSRGNRLRWSSPVTAVATCSRSETADGSGDRPRLQRGVAGGLVIIQQQRDEPRVWSASARLMALYAKTFPGFDGAAAVRWYRMAAAAGDESGDPAARCRGGGAPRSRSDTREPPSASRTSSRTRPWPCPTVPRSDC